MLFSSGQDRNPASASARRRLGKTHGQHAVGDSGFSPVEVEPRRQRHRPYEAPVPALCDGEVATTLIVRTAPIVILGIRHRSWWVAAIVLAIASIPFAGVWLDWIAVVRNSNVSVLYNLPTLPLIVSPLVAWLAGARRPDLRRLPLWASSRDSSDPRPERGEVPAEIVR